jgi:putative nucleotidyltransferase with HDIG domain
MEYVSIRASTLRGDQPIDFDVYIKINDKMILYLRRGDIYESSRLRRLQDKNIKSLFVNGAEEAAYREFVYKNIESAYDPASGKDLPTRASVIHGDQQQHIEQFFENPGDPEAYLNMVKAAARYVDFLFTSEDAVTAILKIENPDGNAAHHGITVAALALALAQKLNKIEPQNIQQLTLGALLHDFGHHDEDISVAQPVTVFSSEEIKSYRGHPERAVENLQKQKHFDPLVLKIIQQHEELLDGSGYPKGLRDKEIDPLALIVSSANALDRIVSFESVPKDEAGKYIIMKRVGKHPLRHLQILNEIIKRAGPASE